MRDFATSPVVCAMWRWERTIEFINIRLFFYYYKRRKCVSPSISFDAINFKRLSHLTIDPSVDSIEREKAGTKWAPIHCWGIETNANANVGHAINASVVDKMKLNDESDKIKQLYSLSRPLRINSFTSVLAFTLYSKQETRIITHQKSRGWRKRWFSLRWLAPSTMYPPRQ